MAKDFSEVGIDVGMLKGSGDQRRGLCPKCSSDRQRNPRALCLSVNIAKGVWKCHNCTWAGMLEPEASLMLPPLPKAVRPFKKPVYRPTPLPQAIIKWFAEVRGISEATLAAERIGYGMHYISEFSADRPCVQFPYRRGDELINVKHVHYAGGKKYPRQEKDAERILYRLNHVDPECLIITEGEIDALSLIEAGYDSVISVPNGAPPLGSKDHETNFAFLASAEDILEPVKKIILAGDNDPVGIALTDELARRLGLERCYQVQWPAGCKDANDVLAKHGKDKLRECIESAKPWPISGLSDFKDIERQLWDVFQNGLQRGLSTGWRNVDQYYTIKPGELTIVTGVPGHYKSTWVSALFMNMVRQYDDWKFAVFSPEHPQVRMGVTYIQQWTGKPFSAISGRMTAEEMWQAYSHLEKHIYWIHGEDHSPTIDYVLDRARIYVFRHGINGLLIDPWNEVDHARHNSLSETEYISQCLSKIRRFAMTNGVHIWVIAHPTKMAKAQSGDYQGKYPVPTPYDIAGSANWRNKASNCISVWTDKDSDSKIVEIHIQKVKFPEVGSTGCALLEFDRQSARFKDYDEMEVLYEVESTR